MAKKKAASCGAGSVAKVVEPATERAEDAVVEEVKEERSTSMIKVGKPAPDFEAPAYHKGEFTTVKLSDYKGKWVLLCFYPGDFTFV